MIPAIMLVAALQVPPNLGINTPATGHIAVEWADLALHDLGAPLDHANIVSMEGWFNQEGTPHDFNNPLNLQTPYDGSWTSTADGDPAWIHIQAYHNPEDWAHAFRLEMLHDGPNAAGDYHYIVWHLRHGTGLEGRNDSPRVQYDFGEYSNWGYTGV
jgi:hypothetical protein